MTLSSQRFTVYDIRQFPLVIMRNQAIVPGYTKRWEEELNSLIAQALPFVIVFPPIALKKKAMTIANAVCAGSKRTRKSLAASAAP